MQEKIEWNEYFMQIAEIVRKKSGCLTRNIGAILVRNNMIISSGYNETPRGYLNCRDGGCERCKNKEASGTKLDVCLCVHAEANCILQAAYNGIQTKDSTLYTTHSPCLYCAKEIINAGIKKIYYKEDYPGIEDVIKMLNICGVETIKWKN